MPLLQDTVFQFETGWIVVVLTALFNSSSSAITKNRLNRMGKIEVFPLKAFALYLFRFFRSPLVWLAIALFAVSTIYWFVSINRMQMSLAYPAIYSLNLLFIFLFSLLFLHENFSLRKAVGAVFLILAFYFFYENR